MTSKIREIILTKVEAEERMRIRQEEKERLKKEGMLALTMVILTAGLSIAAVVLIWTFMDVLDSELEYGFALGYLIGITVVGIAALISKIRDVIERYNPPTEEEMEELGDRII